MCYRFTVIFEDLPFLERITQKCWKNVGFEVLPEKADGSPYKFDEVVSTSPKHYTFNVETLIKKLPAQHVATIPLNTLTISAKEKAKNTRIEAVRDAVADLQEKVTPATRPGPTTDITRSKVASSGEVTTSGSFMANVAPEVTAAKKKVQRKMTQFFKKKWLF